MVNFFSIALSLCCIVILVSVAEGAIDKNPKAVKNWFQKLSTRKEKIAELHIFLHEQDLGINQTSYPVVQPNISFTSPAFFGQVNMIDDILRETIDPNSKVLGRSQGLSGYASLESTTLIMLMNMVFTAGKYNGSSLAVHGSFRLADQYREMNIIGGTGVFRLARGILTAQTRKFNVTSGEVTGEFNVVVVHY